MTDRRQRNIEPEYDEYLCEKCGEPGCRFMVPIGENERPDVPTQCPWLKVDGNMRAKPSKAKWGFAR